MTRKRNEHDLPPKKIALIAFIAIGSIVLGTLFTMTVPEQRRSKRASGLGHAAPIQQSVGRETNGMVWIPSGTYFMGSTNGGPDEMPEHLVTLPGFWMDKHEVTNGQFEKFVQATGHTTAAERMPNSGANWRQPDGPGSSIAGKENYPVVHVSWDDASAYAAWAKKRLPTEAEWEYAARGGLDRAPFVWGADPSAIEKRANVWQGKFPHENTRADGFEGLAPAGSFPPNGWGLHDMAGNVWEWCADWYRPDYYASSSAYNPPGPADSLDPAEPNSPKKVIRGGSYRCSGENGAGYRPAARMKSSPSVGQPHLGFRCVSASP